MRVIMPGGVLEGSRLSRETTLRPLTGVLELSLAEVVGEATPWPRYVSRVLSLAYVAVNGDALDEKWTARLCVADRDYLLLQLVRTLSGDAFWVTAVCPACNSRYDLGLRRSDLPIKLAGPGFPWVSIDAGGHCLTLRLPTGADQSMLEVRTDDEALDALVRACIVAVDDGPVPPGFSPVLGAEAIRTIEARMDEVSPEVGKEVMTACPGCGNQQTVAFDPFAIGPEAGDTLFADIHRLASHYHWSESAILALPRARRLRYLRLIDETQGWVQ